MIAIPLPFVIALLLSILALVIYFRREEDEQPAVIFIALCAVTTTIVGLRWTTEIDAFKFFQPIFASLIPAAAWYCFARAHGKQRFSYWHLLPPILMLLASLTYPFWRAPLDPFLTALYIGYGIALLRLSYKQENIPTQVRLTDIPNTIKAERAASAMLFLSASIDGALALDFGFFKGAHAMVILTFGHALVLPLLAALVIRVSTSIHSTSESDAMGSEQNISSETINSKKSAAVEQHSKAAKREASPLTVEDAHAIIAQVDALMDEKQVYLDPDLTLDRLARKICVPARQISSAINQVFERNVSQVINEYRIAHAQSLLSSTDDTITQIYLNSGFQTKSNFNREFSRVTNQTPSAYRKSTKDPLL